MIDACWYQSSELIYTQKFQKAGMSIFGDAKSCYVKNSGVNSVVIYIHMNILKMMFLDFPSLKSNSRLCAITYVGGILVSGHLHI